MVVVLAPAEEVRGGVEVALTFAALSMARDGSKGEPVVGVRPPAASAASEQHLTECLVRPSATHTAAVSLLASTGRPSPNVTTCPPVHGVLVQTLLKSSAQPVPRPTCRCSSPSVHILAPAESHTACAW